MPRGKTIALTVFAVWLILDLAFWLWYLLVKEFHFQWLYYYLWLFGFGFPLWRYRHRLKIFFRRWSAPGWVKFLLLAYGMVLAEEVLAALFNHLAEGFTVVGWLRRIGQFWAYNIVAFSGVIIGWYVVARRLAYAATELFFLPGLSGLFQENFVSVLDPRHSLLFANPVGFLLQAPLIIATYGLIMTPAVLSLENPGVRRIRPYLKYPLSLLLVLAISIVPGAALEALRTNFPWAFPPVRFIPE